MIYVGGKDIIQKKFSKIDEVVKGAAAEIRKKLATYNSNDNKADFRRLSYKPNIKKEKFETHAASRSPKAFGLFTGTSTNFNLNTQRGKGSKQRPNSRYQQHYTTHTSGRNMEFKLGKNSKSGRNSASKDYKNSTRENSGCEFRSYRKADKLCRNYFTNGALTSTGNLHTRR